MISGWHTGARALAFLLPLCTAAQDENAASVQALVCAGEAALQAGRASDALEVFERAAARQHSASIEVGIVRALMQQGQYRRALAFAGHTAFAHAESDEGAALYAQLLRLGGQAPVAERLIERALQRSPDDAALLRARGVLRAPLVGEGRAWSRPAPSGEPLPADAVVIGQATLLPGGRQAIAPLALLRPFKPLWLRDGLARAVRAEVVRVDQGNGLALLRLIDPLPMPDTAAMATREPFPGSPGYVVAFEDDRTMASWPMLTVGFLGRPSGAGRWLGIEARADSAGAPVFDAAGRLAGVAMPAEDDGKLRFIGLPSVMPWIGMALEAQPSARSSTSLVDEVYELGLHCALQLIVER